MSFISKNKNQLLITSVLFCLWSFFVVLAPEAFLSPDIYISFMSTVPFITIVAVGMTLVVITGEMDLSFASNMAMSGFVFAYVSTHTASFAFGLAAGLAHRSGANRALLHCRLLRDSRLGLVGVASMRNAMMAS